MKHLKISILLLLTVAIFTSCEKETTSILESSKMNEKEIKLLTTDSSKSILEIVESGISLEDYFKNLTDIENSYSEITTSQREEVNPELQFLYNVEDFGCTSLPMEDFENFNYVGYGFENYLDENSDNYVFSPGAILSGIMFEASIFHSSPFFIADDNWGGYKPNVLMSNYYDQNLIINFTTGNVTAASFNLYNLNSTNMYVEVYGLSNNYLGMTSVWVDHNDYDINFVGIQSLEPISKIVISSEYYYGYEGIDNVSFGNCTDLDGDGVLNENDPYPTSNMSATLTIGYNNLNIENVFSAEGTTMMDQIDALIAEMNAQYNGDNYAYLHKRFMSKLSKITYYWTKDRLITRRERSAIYSAASSADVPMSHY